MPRYISFLRGINLGKRRVKMDRLKQIYEMLPFSSVKTFIASGNVFFETDATDLRLLEQDIANKLADELGYEVETHVRSRAELAEVLANVPFSTAEIAEAHALHVTFLRNEPTEADKAILARLESPQDRFQAIGRELYWLTQVSTARPSFSLSELSKAQGGEGTARNIKTVRQVFDLF